MKYYCYRYIDADGQIAYIGRTCHLEDRIKAHEKDLPFDTKPTIEITPCENYRDSVDLELFLIQKYKPYYNSRILPNKYIYHGLVWTELEV